MRGLDSSRKFAEYGLNRSMDDFSPLSSALSSPNASPTAKRKKSLRDAVAAVRKSSLKAGVNTQSTTPVDSPSISSRKSLDIDKHVKDMVEEIVCASPQYKKRDFTFSTSRDLKLPSSSSNVENKRQQNTRAVDFLLLTDANSKALKRFEKSDRYDRTIQEANLATWQGSLSAYGSMGASRANSRSGLLSRGKSMEGSRGGRSRPGTVNEVFEGDVFQSVEEIGETEVKLPLVRVIKVNSSARTALSDNKQRYDFQELLNPRKYRRVINSKPRNHETSDVGSAAVWFEEPISPRLFANSNSELSFIKPTMAPS